MNEMLIALFLHHFTNTNLSLEKDAVEKVAKERGNLVVEILPTDQSFSIARGAQRVPVLNFFVQASCTADVFIESIDVQRRGLGDKNDIDSLYVMHQNKKLSRGRSISRKDGKVQLRTVRHKVPACTSQTLSLYADFSPTASLFSEHRFVFDGSNPIQTIQDVPVTIRSASTSRNIRRLVGPSKGTIEVSYPRLLSPLRYGNNRIVSRFVLSADSKDNHEIRAITFTNKGSARDSDLQNLYVTSGRSQKIGVTKAHLDGDTVRLFFEDPIFLRKGQKKMFQLRADVKASRTRTIQFFIEDPSDIESFTVSGRR